MPRERDYFDAQDPVARAYRAHQGRGLLLLSACELFLIGALSPPPDPLEEPFKSTPRSLDWTDEHAREWLFICIVAAG